VYVAWPRLTRNGNEFGDARAALMGVFLDSARKRSSREVPAAPDARLVWSGDLARSGTDRLALMEALAELPERQRACVVLRYFDELCIRETSRALGCSEGTVKSHTSRGLDTLRTWFDEAGHEELVVTEKGTRTW
jgi:RNA polymerase sigma factor (sigma-70 family)